MYVAGAEDVCLPVHDMFAASVAEIFTPDVNELRVLISVVSVGSRCVLLDMLTAVIVTETPVRIKLINHNTHWHTPLRPPPGSLSSWNL